MVKIIKGLTKEEKYALREALSDSLKQYEYKTMRDLQIQEG